MEGLYYINEHAQCKNYNVREHCFFYQRELKKGESCTINFADDHTFIFVTKGALELIKKSGSRQLLEETFMYALGMGISAEIKANEGTVFFLLTFDKPQIMCDEFVLLGLSGYLPETPPALPSLSMCQPILDFLSQVAFYIEKKMCCRHLYDLKQSEWFFLMRGFYTKKQNATFFYEMVEDKREFMFEVQKYARLVSSVQELAEACHVTTKTLTRRFKKMFETTPKQWLLEQKKQYVKLHLLRSENPKELYDALGFSSYTHLNNFCMKQFGKSMSELKKWQDYNRP